LEFQDIEDPVLSMGVTGFGDKILTEQEQISGCFCDGVRDRDFVGFNQTTSGFT
jgi:hypothetical protein